MSHETDAIERDHFKQALYDTKLVVEGIWREIRGTDNPLLPRIEQLSRDMHQGWLFRKHECPRCGAPSELHSMMVMRGPHHASWDCPKCGSLVHVGDGVLEAPIHRALVEAGWRRKDGGGWSHQETKEFVATTREVIVQAIVASATAAKVVGVSGDLDPTP